MLNIEADVIFIGGAAGAAKSYSLLLRSLRYIKDKNYNAIYFRRITNSLIGAGGLWPEAKNIFAHFKSKIREKPYKILIPSGAELYFSHMELEKNKLDHQGLQYSAIFFDELTEFSSTQFTYLLGRLRSKAKNKSFVMASMNPDPDSWVLKYVRYYLYPDGHEDAGLPDPVKCGLIRYFIVDEGEPIFADTIAELEEKYPHRCWTKNPNTGEIVYTSPKSFTFIGATVFDNPILIENNPNYLSELQSLPEPDRSRFFLGNWFSRLRGSNYFKRDWVKNKRAPLGCISVRGYDKAASEPTELEKYPDYTACIKISKDKAGYFYIKGDFHPSFKDNDSEVLGRFRKRAGERDHIIELQAFEDGTDCKIILPQDPGAAGKTEFQSSASKLQKLGCIVKQDPIPTTRGKLRRFTPFAAACEIGMVFIDEESFPNKESLNAFLSELESFTGGRSTRKIHDDWVDSVASAFNYISRQTVIHSLPISVGGVDVRKNIFNR